MPRKSSGTVYESPLGSDRWHAKFTTTRGRFAIRLVACKTAAEARERASFIAEQLSRLRAAGREDFAEKLLELSAKAAAKDLDRIVRGVTALTAGEFDVPSASESPLVSSPTFREFAERWTSGELHRSYPDHVKRKDSVDDDLYRLTTHIYPIIGDVPLTEFKFDDADLVMRSLPPELSSGSRRHIAQLINRILKLAVYPGRIIEQTPIPKGFLPKPHGTRAQAWLYPREEARLLGTRTIPLLHRLLYGVLAREGMRTSEACRLTWADLDLAHGAVALDENKTDDPRTWALDASVTRALIRWKELTAADADPAALVFSSNGRTVDVEHLANTFRTHLASVAGIRPVLFERKKNRAPIRAHDLRATFVTLALATGQTETWVADRTGHKSSTMINRYRRAARTAMELKVGWLEPLDRALPELLGNSADDDATSRSCGSGAANSVVADANAKVARLSAARRALVDALTNAVREAMLNGDRPLADVALNALQSLSASGSGEQPSIGEPSKASDESELVRLEARRTRRR